ncbi:hypothetical protein SU69_04410 [Thermosipho melanesiensis]|uniref:Uncharacterized protein n=2 Tax=Thermosipho melanesiensis TaxID=46541 RepID=A6LLC3_THEM4|nr:hypothetical protein [Thermosipho melanesiensis]ABR30724.1 hypothetical protein Tmel_0863 [Thermosipho melanesiensis BI429]APT74859.1 hypothetical protein BW47_04640 [Thermosipho melanesiensis]OOC35793.1 hypothetical protein SU68_04465 [Thermosipho melanesiensis]OOC38295.1 hypothetical protein SU69_04410 [Thermosipho melanesiensis]OOC38756.1 hypothetical protein SU70_04410 [Thermosipho melanesiensis]
MKKFFILFVLAVSISIFSLNIYPNLIYKIDVDKFNSTYYFFVKNDLKTDAKITIQKIDFLTDGRKYEFNTPDYKYSIKKHVEVDSYEFILKPNEEI